MKRWWLVIVWCGVHDPHCGGDPVYTTSYPTEAKCTTAQAAQWAAWLLLAARETRETFSICLPVSSGE